MLNGYICLHRKMTEWGWYCDLKTKSLFIHCLLMANWKDSEWMGKIIRRGEFVTGLYVLSKKTGLTVSQTRTALNKLKMTNEIAIKITNKYSIITVCKYDTYQNQNIEDDKQNDKQNDKPIANKTEENSNILRIKKELKKDIQPSKQVDSRHHVIVDSFCKGWLADKGFKYTDIPKDGKELKMFLANNPEISAADFMDVVEICSNHDFHKKFLTIRYVCSHFSTLKALIETKPGNHTPGVLNKQEDEIMPWNKNKDKNEPISQTVS